MLKDAPFRILLAELPCADGSSKPYREELEASLRKFQAALSWIMVPLVVPVALEVLVKPPPPSKNRIHDVDNILRTYIIPKVVDILQPPGHIFWTLDSLRSKHPEEEHFALPEVGHPPVSTRVGITKYEVWKLPRFAGDESPGFVSIAMLADMFGTDDTFSRIDKTVEAWEQRVDD